jgi:hypothetical protein
MGNPLALIELARALDSEELRALPAMTPLPITERLEHAFLGRVSELPSATRSLLLVAALDGAAGMLEILTAASLVDNRAITIDDIVPAEAVGLVSADAQTLRFCHPLIRAAIYNAAGVSERQIGHRALAKAYAADPDRSVWRRATAQTGSYEHVAADLEHTAERAPHRVAPAVAAAALARAAQLSDPASSRGRLLLRAAEIELELGQTDLALKQLAVLGRIRAPRPDSRSG